MRVESKEVLEIREFGSSVWIVAEVVSRILGEFGNQMCRLLAIETGSQVVLRPS